jgi:hypothetical protein
MAAIAAEQSFIAGELQTVPDPKQTYCAVTVRYRINANDALFGFWHRSGEQ